MKIPTAKKEFSFLDNKITLEFDSLTIKPVPNFDILSKALFEESNIDGFYYPAEIKRVELDLKNNKTIKDIPRTRRPASVFNLPASHSITLKNTDNNNDPAVSHEALFIHALAFLYGTRLQFKEWRFDGRVPIKPVNNWYIRDETSFDFLSHLYDFWLRLNNNKRKSVINLFYVQSLSRSLESQWNIFMHSYMLTDAVWRLRCELKGKPKGYIKHSDRIKFLCDEFGIKHNKKDINIITEIRNELFHESLWTGDMIGHGFADGIQQNAHLNLMKLNERLICSVIGYTNEFSRTPWVHFGTFDFDKLIKI